MTGREKRTLGSTTSAVKAVGMAPGEGDEGHRPEPLRSDRAPVARRQFASGVDPRRRTMRRTSRGKIVGHSESMRAVLATLDRVAPTDCTVLVTGETGTGKEALVAALHDASERRHGPLVAVNCGALPAQLIESELFGHVRGAFTDAVRANQGRVAEAEGGTLFLDEIGELPLQLQVKILRLLQQREYRPVGGSQTLRADVRFAAATNVDLATLVASSRFRSDLYYRLDVVHLRIVPLRERAEDIRPLVEHFLANSDAVSKQRPLVSISAEALAALHKQQWAGNVRELENVVHRAALLAAGPMLELADVLPALPHASPDAARQKALPAEGIDFRKACRDFERELLLRALEQTGWNRSRAAELLQLSRTSLVEMIKRLRIGEPTASTATSAPAGAMHRTEATSAPAGAMHRTEATSRGRNKS